MHLSSLRACCYMGLSCTFFSARKHKHAVTSPRNYTQATCHTSARTARVRTTRPLARTPARPPPRSPTVPPRSPVVPLTGVTVPRRLSHAKRQLRRRRASDPRETTRRRRGELRGAASPRASPRAPFAYLISLRCRGFGFRVNGFVFWVWG